MPRRNCKQGRPPVWSVPGPLYGGPDLRRPSEPCPSVPVLPLPVAAAAPAQDLQEEDMPMCRHTNPIPSPTSPGEAEILCLLQRQNELLCEILSAVNSLLAVRLENLSSPSSQSE